MKTNPSSKSGLFHPRVLLALAFCVAGVFLAMFSLAGKPDAIATEFSPASIDSPSTNFSNGITFDHANLNDPVRMVGEPDIAIDNHGGIYVSGPGGSTTQSSWFWKSKDNGIQWHLIGCPDKSNCQNGGGDTEIVIAHSNPSDPTLAGSRDVFAADAQTLQCNSTFRSFDEGQTFTPGEGCFPETDREWLGLFDPNNGATGRRIYLSGNEEAFGCYVLVSTDNGVTYVPPNTANPTAQLPGAPTCIGRFAVDPANGEIFAPVGGGTIFASTNGAVTWAARGNSGALGGVGSPNIFSSIQLDSAGNLWQGWTGSSGAFVTYSTNRGATWHAPIRVSTGPGSPIGTSPDLRQLVFSWLAVGDPGRVALVYYATTDTGGGGSLFGGPNAVWYLYASISTNATSATPTFTQVQAGEHAMHRGTICAEGTGCLTNEVPPADRALADFLMVDKDPQGRVYIAYNEDSDLSDVSEGAGQTYIGKPINAVIRLRTGPSLFAAQGNLLPLPAPANVAITSGSASGGTISVAGTHGLPPGNWATDPASDAPFPVIPITSANHPALDILEASASDDGTNLTFKLKMADLSNTALADAASAGGTPTWMVTWWEGKNGIGPSGITSGPFHSHWFVKWVGQTSFLYGKVSSIDAPTLGAPTPKFLTYSPLGLASGNVTGNLVTINVPLSAVGPLTAGDKIDHVTAYAMVEHADVTANDWADQVKSFSYVIGTLPAGQHLPDGYVQVSLDNFATSALATLNPANNTWTASIPGNNGTVCARQVLAKNLYTPLWDDVQAGPVSCTTIGPPAITSVVSRKNHGTLTPPGDLILNLGTPVTIECRTGGIPSGNHTLVFTFANTLNLVSPVSSITATATTSGGTQTLSPTGSLGTDTHQYFVTLNGVPNASHVTVTLLGVTDSLNNNGDEPPVHMDVLLGDVNSTARTDAGDVTQVRNRTVSIPDTTSASSFRYDVNASGRIDAGDVTTTRNATVTVLP
jgi:hypothetical protein